jgi:hypothetical protein
VRCPRKQILRLNIGTEILVGDLLLPVAGNEI